jgi:hypothetical protein
MRVIWARSRQPANQAPNLLCATCDGGPQGRAHNREPRSPESSRTTAVEAYHSGWTEAAPVSRPSAPSSGPAATWKWGQWVATNPRRTRQHAPPRGHARRTGRRPPAQTCMSEGSSTACLARGRGQWPAPLDRASPRDILRAPFRATVTQLADSDTRRLSLDNRTCPADTPTMKGARPGVLRTTRGRSSESWTAACIGPPRRTMTMRTES